MTTTGSMFTGYGGLDMAVAEVFGAEPLWFADNDPDACRVLRYHWPEVPNLGDVTRVDWTAVPRPDILTGGFPCTDVSAAGKQEGLIRYGDDQTRSGLWAEMCRAIDILRPALVVAENVRGLTSAKADCDVEFCPWCMGDADPESVLRAFGAVLGDLADIGYDAVWVGLRASEVGAPHPRFRVFILAWPRVAAVAAGEPGDRRPGLPALEPGGIGWGGSDHDGAPHPRGGAAADADAAGLEGTEPATGRDVPDRGAAAEPEAGGRGVGDTEPARQQGRSDAGTRDSAADGRAWHTTTGPGGADDPVPDPGGDEVWQQQEPQRRGSGTAGSGNDRADPHPDELCPDCGDPVDWHDVGGFCAGLCEGRCQHPDLGHPGAVVADTAGPRRRRARGVAPGPTQGAGPATGRAVGRGGDRADADPERGGRERRTHDAGREPFVGDAAASAGTVNWGIYEPAIRRWEQRLGRLAPPPAARTSRNGGHQLTGEFDEWLMGLPAGHVTAPGIWHGVRRSTARNAQLRLCGNGVVPQQAVEALRRMLPVVLAQTRTLR